MRARYSHVGPAGSSTCGWARPHRTPTHRPPSARNSLRQRNEWSRREPVPDGPAGRRYDGRPRTPVAHPRRLDGPLIPETTTQPGPRGHRARVGRRRSSPARCRRSPTTRPDRRSRSSDRRNPSTATSPRTSPMKLAKPYRMAPLEIATVLAARAGPGRRRDPDSPIEAAEVAPPGFVNLRLRPDALASDRRWDPGRARRLGHASTSAAAAARQRRVRVGQPDRAAARSATRAARSSATCCSRVLEAGGQRVTREYYFNDSGAQIDNLGASVVAVRAAASPSPRTATTATMSRSSRASVPDDVWARGDGRRRRRGRRRRALGGRPGPRRASRRASSGSACTSTSGPARRRLHDGGLGRARGRAAPRAAATSTSRTARCGSARPTFGDDKDRVIYRSDGDRRTSRPTSATSPRSSAAASTT